jgi:hypothetical protein
VIKFYTPDMLADAVEQSYAALEPLLRLPKAASIAAVQALAEDLTALDHMLLGAWQNRILAGQSALDATDQEVEAVLQEVCDRVNPYQAIGIDFAKFSYADIERCKDEIEAHKKACAQLCMALAHKPSPVQSDDFWAD